MQVNNFIYKTNVVPKQTCKDLIKQINKKEWQKHKWYDTENNTLRNIIINFLIQKTPD